MRWRGEPHARGPSSAVLALGCERVGCAPSAAVRRASQWTTQGQRAEFIPLGASIHVGGVAVRVGVRVQGGAEGTLGTTGVLTRAVNRKLPLLN